jgi:molybdopterin molybdotransferase
MKKGIEMETAQDLLLSRVKPAVSTTIPLFGSSGRVLSADIVSEYNLPPFDRSPLDAYAMRAADIKNAGKDSPVRLKVLEEIGAGYVAVHKVTSGTTIKVMTGAPIPEGADVIIKYEDVTREGDWIKVYQAMKPGSNIVRAGEDVKAGEVVAKKGTRISPAMEGLLSGIGVNQVEVYQQIKTAILSTGDELLSPGEKLLPGKIYNSNMYSLAARCRELGSQTILLGTVDDKVEVIADKILEGIENADIVITSGGVSVGDYDLVQKALKLIGADIIFWMVAMKPGSPIIAAQKDGKIIFGLSGNPAAAIVTFDLIVSPVIKKMSGEKNYMPVKIQVILGQDYPKASPQRRFLRGRLKKVNGVDQVMLNGAQDNGILKSMLGCNVLIEIPEDSPPIKAGQELTGFVIGSVGEAYV